MSKKNSTSADIFRLIIDSGPLTLYLANSKSQIPIGTIHRHFKELKKSGKIKVYDVKGSGERRKMPFGPTLYGFISHYGIDKIAASKMENYFLLWIEYQDFAEELLREGFSSDTLQNPTEAKRIFRKYIQYCSAIEEKIEDLKNGKATLPDEVLLFIGSALLSQDSRYMRIWSELYSKIPGLRKAADEYMENTIQSYRRFKRELNLQ